MRATTRELIANRYRSLFDMGRLMILILPLCTLGCHSQPIPTKVVNADKSKPIANSQYSREDLAGKWKVDLSMPQGKFLTELSADGTYKGNNHIGKWRVQGTLVTLDGFNGGQDYSLQVRDKNHLEGPMDGFQFWR